MKFNRRFLLSLSSSLLISSLVWAESLSKTVYDFDDTLMSTTAYVIIYRNGVDPKTADLSDQSSQTQKISSAKWAEVRNELGTEGAYKDWILQPAYSFTNFSGQPGENAFLGHIRESLSTLTPQQWQAPMWNDFVKQLADSRTAGDVYILTARSSTATQVREGFLYLQSQGYLKNVMPFENIFAVSDPALRLKSNPALVLAKEKSETSKALVMQDMLDELETKTAGQQIATWAFYDDDFANFAKARDSLMPQAAQRWPHVQITIGYVGSQHPNTPPHEVVIQPTRWMKRMTKASGQN
jgi:hypothetical protein